MSLKDNWRTLELEERNKRARKQWAVAFSLVRAQELRLRDAWRPHERAYLDFVLNGKRERARAFLDRIRFKNLKPRGFTDPSSWENHLGR